ncbi:hypothetical protein CRUP_005784, partial [Coryphaenoides rupestris]
GAVGPQGDTGLAGPPGPSGPPATYVQPLPMREGRRKRKRQSEPGEAVDWEELEEGGLPQGDQPLEDMEGMEEVFASLSSMKTEVELMRRPLGTFESPARTCKELMMVQPGYKDALHPATYRVRVLVPATELIDVFFSVPSPGDFWIDPNQGCHRDSVRVYCNFTAGGETCLQPDKAIET